MENGRNFKIKEERKMQQDFSNISPISENYKFKNTSITHQRPSVCLTANPASAYSCTMFIPTKVRDWISKKISAVGKAQSHIVRLPNWRQLLAIKFLLLRKKRKNYFFIIHQQIFRMQFSRFSAFLSIIQISLPTGTAEEKHSCAKNSFPFVVAAVLSQQRFHRSPELFEIIIIIEAN